MSLETVLFVDDDQQLLDGLKRMPEIDGAQLLAEVKKFCPHSVRIILSGQAELQSVFNSIRNTHQYVSKPCNADTLKKVIGRACELRNLLEQRELKEFVSQIECLPSDTAIVEQVIKELNKSEPNSKKLSELIECDIGMSSKILQLVNSAFFSSPTQIVSIEHAISILGVDIIKELVLSVKIFSDLIIPDINIVRKINQHSFAVAYATMALAKNENVPTEKFFEYLTAGLLHDIGKLIFATYSSQKYLGVSSLAKSKGISKSEAETELFGTTHNNLGAYLLALWGFPDFFVDGARFHHEPLQSPQNDFGPAFAIYLANLAGNCFLTKSDDLFNHSTTNKIFENIKVNKTPTEYKQICFESFKNHHGNKNSSS